MTTQTTAMTKYNIQSTFQQVQYNEYVSVKIDNQLFGIPVKFVQDVLREQSITKIPLSSPEISGSLNLRGRIVTAINLRTKLGLPNQDGKKQTMSVVVTMGDELYSLVVDSVGEVLKLPSNQFESNPANLSHKWSAISSGVYQLQNELLVILDVNLLVSSLIKNNQE